MDLRRLSVLTMALLALLALPVLTACSSEPVDADVTVPDPLGIDGQEVTLAAENPGAAEAAELDVSTLPYFTGFFSATFGNEDAPEEAVSASIRIGISEVVLTPEQGERPLFPSEITLAQLVFQDDLRINDGPDPTFNQIGVPVDLDGLGWRFDQGDCAPGAPCSFSAVGDNGANVTLEGESLTDWLDLIGAGFEQNYAEASVFAEFEEELEAASVTLTLSAPEAEVTTAD
jgi:hypothetical protein